MKPTYTAKEFDTCVKCGNEIRPKQEVGWLRDADRKGHFHVQCQHMPTIEGLALVRVPNPARREGYEYMRVKDLKGPVLLPEHPVAAKLGNKANINGVFITEARLSELITEAVQKAGPRIIVTVVAPEEQKAREAIALLSHELFVREETKII
jgi:hypothetical protein